MLQEDPDRAVALVFTSGTTGLPKGVVFCNRQLDAVTAIDVGDRWGGGPRGLASTSLAHLGPMTKLAGNLRGGGTSYLIIVPLTWGSVNNFLVTASDSAGNQSAAAGVLPITQDSSTPPAPTVDDPAGPISVNANTYAISGWSAPGTWRASPPTCGRV